MKNWESDNMVTNHKCIVFAEEHYNPLGVIRSLGESGIKSIGIFINSKEKLASKSKYLQKVYYVKNREEGYEILLKEYGNEREKPYIFTSDDITTSFLDHKYDLIKDKFIFYNAGCKDRITHYMGKDTILQLAEKHGIPVLKNIVVDKGEVPEGLEYPVITKAAISTIGDWKKDVFICNNQEELEEAYKHIRSSRVMLQKYIHKKNELALEAVSANKGTNFCVTIASTYNYILPDTYSPYMTVTNFKDEDLKSKLEAMIREIGFEGIMEIEFLIDQDDKFYFGEINFRNSTWSYASTCAKMPLPIMWIEAMENNVKLKDREKKVPDKFTAMVEVYDYRTRVKTKQISLTKWLNDLRQSNCKYYIGKNDFKPVLAWMMEKIKR